MEIRRGVFGFEGQRLMGLISMSAIRSPETPPHYNFLPRNNAEFHHVRLSPMLPWAQTLEIGLMLPNRSAGARGFGNSGRTLSLSLCFPAVQSCSFPHVVMASKTRKFRFQSPCYDGLKNTIFDPLTPMVCSFWPPYHRSCSRLVQ